MLQNLPIVKNGVIAAGIIRDYRSNASLDKKKHRIFHVAQKYRVCIHLGYRMVQSSRYNLDNIDTKSGMQWIPIFWKLTAKKR